MVRRKLNRWSLGCRHGSPSPSRRGGLSHNESTPDSPATAEGEPISAACCICNSPSGEPSRHFRRDVTRHAMSAFRRRTATQITNSGATSPSARVAGKGRNSPVPAALGAEGNGGFRGDSADLRSSRGKRSATAKWDRQGDKDGDRGRENSAVGQARPFSHRGGWPSQGRDLTVGAGILSIITLMQAGLPLASDRSIAPANSSGPCTSSPCPPSAATTRS